MDGFDRFLLILKILSYSLKEAPVCRVLTPEFLDWKKSGSTVQNKRLKNGQSKGIKIERL